MAEVTARRPGESAALSPGHTAQCAQYRRAYRERNNSLTARVCCCAKVSETPSPPAETRPKVWKVAMGDMPCVWCLLFIHEKPHGPVYAYHPAHANPEAVSVRGWAHAEELVYGDGSVLRDHNNNRCGMLATTLVSGDAVCLGHAMAVLRGRSQ